MEDLIKTTRLSELKQYGITEVAAAIGVFDGVHRGHRSVLAELRRISEKTKAVPVVITFHPHPRSVLSGFQAPPLLIPEYEKLRLLHEAGAKAVVVLPFDLKFASLPPEVFLDRCLLGEDLILRGLCVGRRWRFGANAAGDRRLLEQRSKSDGFLFSAVPELTQNGHIVCSTAIRHAIAKGDLATAEQMLGRPYSLFGEVVHGLGLADKMLDSPTANLRPDAGVLPPFGVYATLAEISGDPALHPSVTDIGVAPTIRTEAHPEPKIEVHFLDFRGNLYGKQISIRLMAGLREEKHFESPEQLRKQIVLDVASAREILKGTKECRS